MPILQIKFLLSADAAFKLEGNVAALSKVLDAANTIENEYATEIQKIAEGFPLVANVASMANMTAEQLTAALGTITAATQESGSMAALRHACTDPEYHGRYRNRTGRRHHMDKG